MRTYMSLYNTDGRKIKNDKPYISMIMYSFNPVEYSGGFVGVALRGTLIPQGIAGVTSNTLLK